MPKNMESTYALRKAALAKMAEPSSVAAVPDLAEVAGEHAAAKGKAAAESAGHERDLAFGAKSRAEKNRQFFSSLALDRERLDDWADQNRWATGIAIANLGIQALAIPAALRQEEKQEKMISSILAERGKQTAAATAANEARAATQEKAFGELRAAVDYNRQIQDARNLVGDPQTMAEIAAIQEKTTQGTQALQAADKPHFTQTNSPDLYEVARRKTGGMPVWYQH